MNNHTVQCPSCKVKMVSRRNSSGGGIFYGCSRFESHGCRVSWSPTTCRFFGGGPARSLRDETISRLERTGLVLDKSEASRFIDAVGLIEAMKLVA